VSSLISSDAARGRERGRRGPMCAVTCATVETILDDVDADFLASQRRA
jgi:hypothetical protein